MSEPDVRDFVSQCLSQEFERVIREQHNRTFNVKDIFNAIKGVRQVLREITLSNNVEIDKEREFLLLLDGAKRLRQKFVQEGLYERMKAGDEEATHDLKNLAQILLSLENMLAMCRQGDL